MLPVVVVPNDSNTILVESTQLLTAVRRRRTQNTNNRLGLSFDASSEVLVFEGAGLILAVEGGNVRLEFLFKKGERYVPGSS